MLILPLPFFLQVAAEMSSGLQVWSKGSAKDKFAAALCIQQAFGAASSNMNTMMVMMLSSPFMMLAGVK